MGQVLDVLSRRWSRRALLVLLALDLLVAGGVVALHAGDRAEAFTADDAVAGFRREAGDPDGAAGPTTTIAPDAPGTTVGGASPTTAPAATAAPDPAQPAPAADPATAGGAATPAAAAVPPFPAAGVYVYETTGFEEVDALGGSRHDYPATTTIVHRAEGCGATETWQPFEDRKDVRQLCGEPGRHRLAWFDATRSFFGQTDTRRLECDEGAAAFVAGARAGDVHRFRCVDETGTAAANRLEVLGVEQVVVGGQAVEALHTLATSEVSGANSGSSRIESWVDPTTGLTLKRVSVLDGRSPGPGRDISYHEEYSLVLTSLAPRT